MNMQDYVMDPHERIIASFCCNDLAEQSIFRTK